ncbi:histone-lysine N-methyltransferase SETMAR [Trichonephila clavipes]|nr:histone-lysine N-methyltransferase SETMAR [Trichonephila clavipes]
MVTEDEKWVTYDNIVRKRSWLKRGEAAQTVAKPRLELANRRVVVFHQDSARPHTSVVTRQKLWELGWEVLMHPPYSSDLAPSDYHLFLTLQNFLSDKKLGSREDRENRLLEFFTNKNQNLYERGVVKLPLKWQQIIQQNGTYLTQIGLSKPC